MGIKYSIIVPAYNEEELIGDCLDSLNNQDFDTRQYEVIVVDNSCTDQTSQIAQNKGARIITESDKGYVNALIKGGQFARGKILIYTDADCRAPRQWLKKIDEVFEESPELDAVGGVFAFFDGNWFENGLAKLGRQFTWHLCGGNMAVTKQAYHRLGGFKKAVNLGADTLFSIDLNKQGKVIIDKNNLVYTSARRYSDNLPFTLYMYLLNDLSLIFTGKPFFSNFPDIRRRVGGIQDKVEDLISQRIQNRSLVFTSIVTLFLASTIYLITPTLAQAKDLPFVKNQLNQLQKTIQQADLTLNQNLSFKPLAQ